tara:strand:- start:92 stop:199 length:108 start_codon:yes stop_codon:yes gene_type:complete
MAGSRNPALVALAGRILYWRRRSKTADVEDRSSNK